MKRTPLYNVPLAAMNLLGARDKILRGRISAHPYQAGFGRDSTILGRAELTITDRPLLATNNKGDITTGGGER